MNTTLTLKAHAIAFSILLRIVKEDKGVDNPFTIGNGFDRTTVDKEKYAAISKHLIYIYNDVPDCDKDSLNDAIKNMAEMVFNAIEPASEEVMQVVISDWVEAYNLNLNPNENFDSMADKIHILSGTDSAVLLYEVITFLNDFLPPEPQDI